MQALGRLLRLSLAPTAAADIAAGGIVGARGSWPGTELVWLIAASLAIVHGAMALNDWADREEDARERPDRPIPSGRIGVTQALALGLVLLGLGPFLAWSIAPPLGVHAGTLALLAATYDTLGRGPLLGPSLLALCRAGNLSLGIHAGMRLVGAPIDPVWFVPAVLYGGYVFFVSRLGRLEDGQDEAPLGPAARRYLSGVVLCLIAAPAASLLRDAPAPGWRFALALALALLASAPLLRSIFGSEPWSRGRVMQHMGMVLRRLLVFTGSVALCAPALAGSHDALWVTLGIALGYPLSFWLRRAFPPS